MSESTESTISFERLELIEAALPQVERFQSAIGVRSERRALFIRWWDADGHWGLGECSCRPDPFYSHEFNSAAVEMVRHHAFPLIERQGTIRDLLHTLGRIRGWAFTKAALLDAALDLLRRRDGQDELDQRDIRTRRIPAGISLGIFDSADAAVERVGRAIQDGYHRVKMKVSPDMDIEPLAAVRQVFPRAPLAFDANGSCDIADLPGFVTALNALSPLFVEQPFPPSRLDWCAEAKNSLPELRLALDESIEDTGSLAVALRLGACDEINIKPGRVGGQFAALELMDQCATHRLPVWLGGMFETGIGRMANLRLAACVEDAVAHDLSPSHRYFTRDVVTTPLEMDADGFIPLDGEQPVEIDWTTVEELTQQRWEVGPR